MSDLTGKVAFVTGGGSGIGDAVARRLVAQGVKVGVAGRRVAPLERLSEEIGVFPQPCDVTDAAAVEHAIEQLVERYGGLDIVVNNAGATSLGSVEQLDESTWASIFELNVNGPMRVSKRAIPHLRRRGGGAIVNVSSVGAIFAAPNAAVYGTTKAALLGLTRSMARDFGSDGIRVNSLCPGWVDTPMVEPLLQILSKTHGESLDDARHRLVRYNPIDRMASPDEIARCVEFLVSEASSFVTGAVLMADGGQSIVDVGMLPVSELGSGE